MGSNSVASFLTKLLRPDKKEKQKQPVDNKRRHSAPVPDWCEITVAEQHPGSAQKLPEKQKKLHVKYASQQNLAGSKKQKNAKSKQANNKSKRQSAGFPSWFCVSGNVETLERTALPLTDNGTNNYNMSNNQRLTANNEKHKNDDPGLNEGRKGRAKENRYVVPPVERTSKKTTAVSGQSESNGKVPKPAVKQVRRDLSPGVKYRTDGTLEKPYVFPAGLTFGPEGRKLQLRRTNHPESSEKHSHVSHTNGKTVKVDVHRSSTEDIIMEYSYEEIQADPGEFDVRKAFYLKYDSDFSDAKTQENSVDCDDNYRHQTFNNNNDHSYIRKGDMGERQNNMNAQKLKTTTNSGVDKINHQNNGSRKDGCRYSMPPQNDDLVYMGSFENVNLSDYVLTEKDTTKTGLNVVGNIRRSGRDTTKSRRNRYSMPSRNSELVYMGSFENVNHLLTGNGNAASGFSLYSDASEIDERWQYSSGERCRGSVDQNEKPSAAIKEKDNYVLSGYTYHRRCDSMTGTSTATPSAVAAAKEATSLCSLTRISMSDKYGPKNLNKSSQNVEKDARSTSEDDISDVYDASSLSGDMNDKNPFLTRRGRSSCMPGNSRCIAPPPAVTASHSSTSSADTHSARSSLFMPGSRRFSLPPPPNYTPPKEEMEFTHAHLKDMICDKGSQTDLSIDLEHLTMEDRDVSLQREEMKTVYAGVTSQTSAVLGGDHSNRAIRNGPDFHGRAPKGISVNTELHAHMLDVSDLSHGSDEVFQDTQNSVSEDNERMKTRRFTKFRSKISSNLAQNKLPITSSLSYSKDLNQKSSITESKIINRTGLTGVACKNNPASAPETTRTWTPARSDRPQTHCSGVISSGHDKPIPTPRRIYHADSMNKNREQAVVSTDTSQAFRDSLVKPVPKQRHSLAYSRSISPSNSYEAVSSPVASQDGRRSNRQQLLRTQSCDQSSTSLRKQNNARLEVSQGDFSQNIYVSINDEHVYEEIDPQLNTSDLNSSKYEDIYEKCGNADSENRQNKLQKKKAQNDFSRNGSSKLENSLSPLQTITLSVSPGQKRRNLTAQKENPTQPSTTTQSQHNCGLPASPIQPNGVCAPTEHANGGRAAMIDIHKKCQYDDSDDNSSIADDEMSLSNDEDTDDFAKRYSLRRCVSADNLLRSGSIIDRSMILAKRRKKRMKERRYKSQLQLSTDTKYNLANTTFKVHYTKRKRTSNERLFKQKASHTDSGLDSEIVSPCTSPDTRRHVDNMTSLNNADGLNDISDSWVPRQGTLPRKSWEIRLRNTQHLRKCRSRESLLTPSAKLFATSNSVFDSGY
ncbi:hypothetical protein BsWGS_08320 [Bradybaena similaris]